MKYPMGITYEPLQLSVSAWTTQVVVQMPSQLNIVVLSVGSVAVGVYGVIWHLGTYIDFPELLNRNVQSVK